MSEWKTKRLLDLVVEAERKYQEMLRAVSTACVDYNTIQKGLKSAYWWEFCHPVQGYGGQLLRRYTAVTMPDQQVDPSNQEHQQLARIAGYWVPGRRPGAKNKIKPANSSGPSQMAAPIISGAAVTATKAAEVSSSVDAISALIDTNSLSRRDIYTVLACILKAALNNPREGEERQEFQNILDVFMAELEGK